MFCVFRCIIDVYFEALVIRISVNRRNSFSVISFLCNVTSILVTFLFPVMIRGLYSFYVFIYYPYLVESAASPLSWDIFTEKKSCLDTIWIFIATGTFWGTKFKKKKDYKVHISDHNFLFNLVKLSIAK